MLKGKLMKLGLMFKRVVSPNHRATVKVLKVLKAHNEQAKESK